ncbi:protein kinase, ATP binding site-containing protein [Tanacetum coccineum]
MSWVIKRTEELLEFQDIQIAAKHFSSDQLAEGGGFASVYKGQLSERWQNRTAAIKCLNQSGNEMIIVTEYAINGSLDRHLEDQIKRGGLTWEHRLRICLGAARGLDYLHLGHGKDNKVVHRDVKSANILLDKNMEAKICDFGMSKAGQQNQQSTGIYTKAAGTPFTNTDPHLNQKVASSELNSDRISFGVCDVLNC